MQQDGNQLHLSLPLLIHEKIEKETTIEKESTKLERTKRLTLWEQSLAYL